MLRAAAGTGGTQHQPVRTDGDPSLAARLLGGYLRGDVGDHNPFTVSDSFLLDYLYDISQLIEGNMPKQTSCHCLGDKFASAVCTVDAVKRSLYGRVDVRLHEELTAEELDSLKKWITSQNEAACDLIEGQPIDSEDGLLAISLWHGGSDYFVSDCDELDEYIEQQNELRIGGCDIWPCCFLR